MSSISESDPSDDDYDWTLYEIEDDENARPSSHANDEQSTRVANCLAQWIVQSRIAHRSASNLLKILNKEANLLYIPLDVRTLLKSSRGKVNVVDVPLGKYYHFDVKSALYCILKAIDGSGQNIPSVIEILFNVDGISVSASSKSEFWPILCKVVGKY